MGNLLNLINIKTVVAVLVVAILVAAIPVTTRLTQQQTQLESEAAIGDYGSISVSKTTVSRSGAGWESVPGTVTISVPGADNTKTVAGIYVTKTENVSSGSGWTSIGSFYGTNGTVQFSWTPPGSYSPGNYTLGLFWINNNVPADLIDTTDSIQLVDSTGGGGATGDSCSDDLEYCDTDVNQLIHKHGGYWDGSQCIYAFDVIGQCNQGPSCGATCTYSQVDTDGVTRCYSGNCKDGSQNCSFNTNCGYVDSCSTAQEVACPGTGSPGTSRPIDDVPIRCKTSQTCTAPGKDTSCPEKSQWCYDGFCINDNYNPVTKTCPAPVSDPSCISPGPVTNLRPTDGTEYPAGKRTVTLQWDAPSGGGPLSHYNVRFDDPTTTGAGKEPDIVADNYSSTSLQIPDLDNPTLYSWWVDAVSSCGAQPSRAGASFSILGGSANVNYIIEGDVLNEKSNPVGGATICLDPPEDDKTCSTEGLLKSTTSATDQSGLIAGKYHIENVPPANSGHNVFISPPQGYSVTSENPVLVNQEGISQNKYVGFKVSSTGTTCAQVPTRARNTATNECKDFPTTCLDAGWVADPNCTTPTTPQVGTACYIVTEDLLERDNFENCSDSKAIPYDQHPEKLPYTLLDQTAGVKTIFVRFIASDGSSEDFQKAILYKPGAALTEITCSYAPEGTATNITITGTNLGAHTQLGTGGITVGGKKTQVTWTEGQTEISIQVPERLQSEIPILFQPDGGTVIRGSCVVNLATMNFTANIQCRPPGNLGAQDVQVQIYENLATSSATPRPIISQEIVLDKDGLPTRFTPQLETGKSYTMIIKAPGTVARKVIFTASAGTVIVPGSILLPVGNIAPATLADDQINAFDKSELIRQWTLVSDVVRSGDFNLDKRVNSVDYACMRPNLDTSSPTHQDEKFVPATATTSALLRSEGS